MQTTGKHYTGFYANVMHVNNFFTLLVSYITFYIILQYANIVGCSKINWLLEVFSFTLYVLLLCTSYSKTMTLMHFYSSTLQGTDPVMNLRVCTHGLAFLLFTKLGHGVLLFMFSATKEVSLCN